MTTFSRMDTAISYAMDSLDAGAVLEMIPFNGNVNSAETLQLYASDFNTGFIHDYAARVAAGAEFHGYTLLAKVGNTTEWIGDLHIVYWPLAPEAEPMFVVAYAA